MLVKQTSNLLSIHFEWFAKYFDKPSLSAAKEMGISHYKFNIHKQKAGISLWPYRQIVSLSKKVSGFHKIKPEFEYNKVNHSVLRDYQKDFLIREIKSLQPSHFTIQLQKHQIDLILDAIARYLYVQSNPKTSQQQQNTQDNKKLQQKKFQNKNKKYQTLLDQFFKTIDSTQIEEHYEKPVQQKSIENSYVSTECVKIQKNNTNNNNTNDRLNDTKYVSFEHRKNTQEKQEKTIKSSKEVEEEFDLNENNDSHFFLQNETRSNYDYLETSSTTNDSIDSQDKTTVPLVSEEIQNNDKRTTTIYDKQQQQQQQQLLLPPFSPSSEIKTTFSDKTEMSDYGSCSEERNIHELFDNYTDHNHDEFLNSNNFQVNNSFPHQDQSNNHQSGQSLNICFQQNKNNSLVNFKRKHSHSVSQHSKKNSRKELNQKDLDYIIHLQSKKKKIEEKIHQLQKEQEQARNKYNKYKSDMLELRKDLLKMQGEFSRQIDGYQEHKIEVKNISEHIGNIDFHLCRINQQKMMCRVPKGQEILLKELEQSGFKKTRIIGIIRQLAHVTDTDVNRAISVALGPYDINSIVVTSTKAAKKWQKILSKRHGIHDVSFIALNTVSDIEAPKFLYDRFPSSISRSGFCGFAINFLKYSFGSIKDKLHRFFYSILGHTLLFSTIEDAERFRMELNALGERCPNILTLSGELISEQGTIRSFSISKHYCLGSLPTEKEQQNLDDLHRKLLKYKDMFKQLHKFSKKAIKAKKSRDKIEQTNQRGIGFLSDTHKKILDRLDKAASLVVQPLSKTPKVPSATHNKSALSLANKRKLQKQYRAKHIICEAFHRRKQVQSKNHSCKNATKNYRQEQQHSYYSYKQNRRKRHTINKLDKNYNFDDFLIPFKRRRISRNKTQYIQRRKTSDNDDIT